MIPPTFTLNKTSRVTERGFTNLARLFPEHENPYTVGHVCFIELELELILSQMAQKPMLRGEVGARALFHRQVPGLSIIND
jgi:hypothetical protein